MAVISFKEISDGREGDGELGRRGTLRRYTRVWRVVTDTNTDEGSVILAYVDCPQLGSVYPWDSGCWLRTLKPRQEIGKRVWILTGGYSDEFETEANPLNDPAEITWTTEFREEAAPFDKDGYAILNAAGDPFDDPPPTADRSTWTVRIRTNQAAVPTWLLGYGKYGGAVNSDSVMIDGVSVAANCAKIKGIEISGQQERNGTGYRSVVLTIQFKDEGWTKKYLNKGFNQIVTGTKWPIVMENQATTKTAALLDANGAQLVNPTPATATWISANHYPQLPFSVLPLN